MILVVLVILVLIVLAVAGYFLMRPTKKPEPKEPTGRPDPDTSAKGTCSFEGEDVYNKKVFSYNGDLVQPKTQVDCSQCNQYVVKQDNGCLPMGYDSFEGDVCVAGFRNAQGNWGLPPITKCPFDKSGKIQ
jgi:hypothetical protein